MRPPRALPAAHFDRNERHAYFGNRTLMFRLSYTGDSVAFLNLRRSEVPVLDNVKSNLGRHGGCPSLKRESGRRSLPQAPENS